MNDGEGNPMRGVLWGVLGGLVCWGVILWGLGVWR